MKKKFVSVLLALSTLLMSCSFAGCKDAKDPSDDDPSETGGTEIVTPGGDVEPGDDPIGGGTTNPGQGETGDDDKKQPGGETGTGDNDKPETPIEQSAESKQFDEGLKKTILDVNYTVSCFYKVNGVEKQRAFVESTENLEHTTIIEGKESYYEEYIVYEDDITIIYKRDSENGPFTKSTSKQKRDKSKYLTSHVEEICLLSALLGHYDDFETDNEVIYDSTKGFKYLETQDKNGKKSYRYNIHDVNVTYSNGRFFDMKFTIDDLKDKRITHTRYFANFGTTEVTLPYDIEKIGVRGDAS